MFTDPTGQIKRFFDWISDKFFGSAFVLQRRLDKAGKSILKACQDGNIYVMKTDQTGEFVRCGKVNFYSGDSLEDTKYIEALDFMEKVGIVRHESGQLFVLTSEGYKIRKKIQ